MNSGLLEHMRAFVAIARAGTLTAASIHTGLAQPTISRQLLALERHFGCTLVRRSTRALNLTPQGERFLELAQEILRASEAAEQAMRGPELRLKGRLRVSCSHGFYRHLLVPLLPLWQERHPQVHVQLVLSDDIEPLVAKNLDVAFRIGSLRDSGLVVTRLGDFEQWVVASRSYLDRQGSVLQPGQLTQHHCILHSGGPGRRGTWLFQGPGGKEAVGVTGSLSVSSVEALRDAVMAGMGVAVTPSWFWKHEAAAGKVVRLLQGWELPRKPVVAVTGTRADRRGNAGAFIEFVAGALAL